MPFVQRKIREMFPRAKLIADKELETITASGAVVHALQVLNKEVEPYMRSIGYQALEEERHHDLENLDNQLFSIVDKKNNYFTRTIQKCFSCVFKLMIK